jgi:L-xylulokinase
MAGNLYLSIDCGLTATKAAVFDDAGNELSCAVRDTEVRSAGDASEIDMEGQWKLAAAVIREAVSSAAVSGREIACVAASGHGGGLYPIDGAGKPFRPALTSMDGRASPIVAEAERQGFPTYPTTRHRPWAGQSLPQLRWLKDAGGGDYERARWFLGAKDWVRYRLTGEAGTDRTDASNNGLVGIKVEAYDPSLLSAFGVSEAFSKLPPISSSASLVGVVSPAAALETGLAAGTPVAAGMFDVVACAVGSGALGEESYSIIAGTWNINSAFDSRLLEAPPSVKTSLGPDEGRYAYVESSATSAGNLSWFLAIAEDLSGSAASPDARGAALRRIDSAVDKCPVGSRGVVYLPFIRLSDIASGVGASFAGMRADHGAGELARAVFEGVAFAHRAHLERLEVAGLRRGRVLLSGGATKSDAWCRVFAGALGRPVETSDASQAGARGVAMGSAIATGRYSSYDEASAAMTHVDRRFEPEASQLAAYEDAYARWLETASLLGKARSK